jgi:hypothetical protein
VAITRAIFYPARKTSKENIFLRTRSVVMQGWEMNAEDIGLIQGLLAEHRDWGRTRLGEELCCLWDWRNAQRSKEKAPTHCCPK